MTTAERGILLKDGVLTKNHIHENTLFLFSLLRRHKISCDIKNNDWQYPIKCEFNFIFLSHHLLVGVFKIFHLYQPPRKLLLLLVI